MNSLFHACSAAVFSRISRLVLKTSVSRFSALSQWSSCDQSGVRYVRNLDALLRRTYVRCYSAKRSSGGKSRSKKVEPTPVMKDEKEAFFVVRKGDLVGVYKSLTECQFQVGSSISNPPVSVYKGYSMPKDTKEYLQSCGLKNALYSIRAADLTEDIFGTLFPCPFQQPSSSRGEASVGHVTKRRPQEMLWAEFGQRSCVLEFDGASKGNPGQAGAGAVLRTDDGSLICRLREGLGIATNNFAEYRGIILGLRYALEKGFTSIRVKGDSKLVCMQILGTWKVKNQNISTLYEEAKRLKDRFLSFQINHVARDLNTEADAQANLAIDLTDGQVQEDIDK